MFIGVPDVPYLFIIFQRLINFKETVAAIVFKSASFCLSNVIDHSIQKS